MSPFQACNLPMNGSDSQLIVFMIQRILQECSCFIEFIKRVEEKRSNAGLVEHFISFSQQV